MSLSPTPPDPSDDIQNLMFTSIAPSTLCIYQYNTHGAHEVHHSILNDPVMEHFDLLMIQEPYTYTLDNSQVPTALSHHKLHLILLDSLTETMEKLRAIIYVNLNVLSTLYQVIPFPSCNITALSFSLPTHSSNFTFINIYNPPSTFSTFEKLEQFILSHPCCSPDSPFVIMGNFNLHHALWNDPMCSHLEHQRWRPY